VDSKLDPRTERVDQLIRLGLMEMLEEKAYDEITVTDIAQRAGVSRKTFYAHYENKNILYDQMVSEAVDALCSKLIYHKERDDENYQAAVYRDCLAFLGYMEENRDMLMHILHPSLYLMWFSLLESAVYMKKKELYIKVGPNESESDIPNTLFFGIITSSLVVWIYWWLSQENCTLTQGAEHLSRLICRSMANIFRYSRPH